MGMFSPLVRSELTQGSRDADSRMQQRLEKVHQEMTSLQSDMNDERDRLQRQNSRLKDAVSELKLKGQVEMDSFKKEIDRMREGMEEELRAAEEFRDVASRDQELVRKVGLQKHVDSALELMPESADIYGESPSTRE